MNDQSYAFQAEVSRLLDIVTHSLYSDKSVFLRELISNASDACDKLRYLNLTNTSSGSKQVEYQIKIILNKSDQTLIIQDNGIGMNRDDLMSNLGTIARSGTAKFLNEIEKNDQKNISLIGQFGVGFYSAFMVAHKVDVYSCKAGETEGWIWSSEGKGQFTINPQSDVTQGTKIVLHLKKDAKEYLEPERIKHIVRQYSDHIDLPIILVHDNQEERINKASALWSRAKSDISEDQYKEFYHHTAHAFDDPWLTMHFKAEGKIEYSGILFVPSTRPMDIFYPERRQWVKLYVKRVFITDDCKDILPTWLRFIRGVVDSEDLPLNISREMLQHNPILSKIRAGLVKRIINELQKKSDLSEENYIEFWNNFGAVLKEGLYEDNEYHDQLLELGRFATSEQEKLTSLSTYVQNMKPNQEAIYFITGENIDNIKRSPHLEGFAARKIDVLLLSDPIDEFWINKIKNYKGKEFQSITKGSIDLNKIAPLSKEDISKKNDTNSTSQLNNLVALFRLTLNDNVKDVRLSERLTDSPVCLIADDNDLDIHLEKILKQHQQLQHISKRILEINPNHPLILALAHGLGQNNQGSKIEEMAWLLFDQAQLAEGEIPKDLKKFSQRLGNIMQGSLAQTD
ncbi:MAG: molecular chaperone HtpG [Alphaproteobacteria bacterium]|nr:molecular chaperone HtpG [Alphaproteobacteria bacterium]